MARAAPPASKAIPMSSLKARLDKIPEGSAALFFIQMFSTLGYAVLQTSLVLYATKHLHFNDDLALSLMSLFGAFNYGLHLFGGYLGGRFLSNRNLFVGGMAFPDPSWQQRITLVGGLNAFVFVLGPYWLIGWLLISGVSRPAYPLPQGAWFALCISLCMFGSVLMIAADAQKHFTLRLRRGLITDGVHR